MVAGAWMGLRGSRSTMALEPTRRKRADMKPAASRRGARNVQPLRVGGAVPRKRRSESCNDRRRKLARGEQVAVVDARSTATGEGTRPGGAG